MLTLTLKRNPIVRAFTIRGVTLERVQVIRDLGILLGLDGSEAHVWGACRTHCMQG